MNSDGTSSRGAIAVAESPRTRRPSAARRWSWWRRRARQAGSPSSARSSASAPRRRTGRRSSRRRSAGNAIPGPSSACSKRTSRPARSAAPDWHAGHREASRRSRASAWARAAMCDEADDRREIERLGDVAGSTRGTGRPRRPTENRAHRYQDRPDIEIDRRAARINRGRAVGHVDVLRHDVERPRSSAAAAWFRGEGRSVTSVDQVGLAQARATERRSSSSSSTTSTRTGSRRRGGAAGTDHHAGDRWRSSGGLNGLGEQVGRNAAVRGWRRPDSRT